ncbi:MAG: alpha/beta hydrolase [Pseudomonadales bacterium]|nr:alpha/beta hydrolase [Pseudomonadales bacterium]
MQIRSRTTHLEKKSLSWSLLLGTSLLLTGCPEVPDSAFWAENVAEPGIKKEYVEVRVGESATLAWNRSQIIADIGEITEIDITPQIGTVDPLANGVTFVPEISSHYTAAIVGSEDLLMVDSGEVIVLREYCDGTDVHGNEYQVDLDLQLPNDAEFPNGNFPAIVFIHPGGWDTGDYSDFYAYMPEATGRGYAAISINHRLSQSDEMVWPGHIQDAKCAVRWLRANAQTYNLNPEAIAAVGFSAGGHLAAMLGVTDQSSTPEKQSEIDRFKNEGGFSGVDDSVQAVVSIAGLHDLAASYFNEGGGDVYTKFLGRLPVDGDDALYALASPVHYVDAQSAAKPFLMINSELDITVTPVNGCRLKLALESAGSNNAHMLLYPEGSHLSYVEYRDFRNVFSGATLHKTINNVFLFLDYQFMSGPEPSASYSDPLVSSASCETLVQNDI